MPEKMLRNHAPHKSTNPPASVKNTPRPPTALDGHKLNEKKGGKLKATYSDVLNNYESIRNMVTYPATSSAEEVVGGKKRVSISV